MWFDLFGIDYADYLRRIHEVNRPFLTLAIRSQAPPNVTKVTEEEFTENGITYRSILWKYYEGKVPMYYNTTEVVEGKAEEIQQYQEKLDACIKEQNFEQAVYWRDKIAQAKENLKIS